MPFSVACWRTPPPHLSVRGLATLPVLFCFSNTPAYAFVRAVASYFTSTLLLVFLFFFSIRSALPDSISVPLTLCSFLLRCFQCKRKGESSTFALLLPLVLFSHLQPTFAFLSLLFFFSLLLLLLTSRCSIFFSFCVCLQP